MALALGILSATLLAAAALAGLLGLLARFLTALLRRSVTLAAKRMQSAAFRRYSLTLLMSRTAALQMSSQYILDGQTP